MASYSYPKEKMKILLLEGVHDVAVSRFADAGYSVETHAQAFSEEELLQVIPKVHVLGIRSKTEVTERVLARAKHLLSIGCFCIGTNQVSLGTAEQLGVSVFNAPFSNTRSVAELAMAEMVMLARRASHKSMLLHDGIWEKSAEGCFEVRHKTVGIIGYGHIGPQVGLLAESFGMRVLYYDILPKLSLGNAVQVPDLDSLLKDADFVTLHVPETPLTKRMIGARELSLMKEGAYLLNLSRGSVVDISALAAALKSERIGGAAVDVFPIEPKSNKEEFVSELRRLPNVILTPHIGGSTNEAQRNIGLEVSASLLRFIETGSSTGAVNFPQVELPVVQDRHRLLNIHRNVPGVLKDINAIIAEMGMNISAQYLSTSQDIGYLIMDVDQAGSQEMKERIEALPTNIRTRLLF
jgi:D-3-phosphoglycerate dehydrogenase / 2-oxoglutarate reductase